MARKDILDFGFDDIEFRVTAIHSALPAPVLAWHADRVLGTAFGLCPEPLQIVIRKQASSHNRYLFTDPESGCEWWLVENNGSGGSLFSARPTPDLLLVAAGADEEGATAEWTANLNKITGVSMAYDVAETEMKKMTWVAELFGQPPVKPIE